MPLTQLSSVTWDQAAYERLAYFALRSELYFDGFAEVRPTRQSMPGTSVIFNITHDITPAATPISETTDVDPAVMSDSTVSVPLHEYGNVVKTTARLRGTSYLPVDEITINVVAFNAGSSLDLVARHVMVTGSNVTFVAGKTSRANIAADDHFGTTTSRTGAESVRYVVAKLRGANVPTIGGAYVSVVHPDVSYDFRGATGGANWRDPHTYARPEGIFNGEIGQFEGVRFIESPRAAIFPGAGQGGTNVYTTLVFGQQALAKAWSMVEGNGPLPVVRPTPVTDNLRRFLGVGWYWLGGYGLFRQAALWRIESSSSIGS
jgi:N4-gp56 family major capsid protein